MKRALDTGSTYDVALGNGTYLWVAVFDHTQTRHSWHMRRSDSGWSDAHWAARLPLGAAVSVAAVAMSGRGCCSPPLRCI